jgi:RHS repeat-associated protein
MAGRLAGTYGPNSAVVPQYGAGTSESTLDLAFRRIMGWSGGYQIQRRFMGGDGGSSAFTFGVNPRSGNLLLRLALPYAGPGTPPIYLFYNSRLMAHSSAGRGWRHLLDQSILYFGPESETLETMYHLVSVKNAKGATWTIDRTGTLGLRDIAGIDDPYGGRTTFTYDSRGRLQEIEDPGGRSTAFEVDTSGLLTKVTLPGSTIVTLVYDDCGAIKSWVNPTNQTTTFVYNSCGRIKSIQVPGGGISEYKYPDDTTRVLVDPLGKTVTMTLDTNGHIHVVNEPEAITTTYTWDAHHRLLSATDGRNNKTTFTYESGANLARRLRSVQRPQGTMSFDYDSTTDRLTKITDEQSNVTTLTWTGGVRTGYQDPRNTYAFGYTANGELESVTDAANERSAAWTYDTDGLWETTTDADGEDSTLSYTSNRQLETITDPRSRVTGYQYDALNRLTRVALPNSTGTTYAYDATGRTTLVHDGVGEWKTEYDDANRKVMSTEPSNQVASTTGQKTTLTYDVAGNLLSEESPNHVITTYSYDGLHRLTGVAKPLGVGTSYAYDKSHNRTAVQPAGSGIWTTSYDANNRPHIVTDPRSRVTTYTYFPDDSPKEVTDATNKITSYTYNSLRLAESTKDRYGNLTTFTYDSAGRLTATARRANATTVLTTTHSYYKTDRLKAITDPLNHKTTYVYDAIGRKISETDPLNHTTSFQFNDVYRTMTVIDPESNVVTHTYDLANRLMHVTRKPASAEISTTTTYYPNGQVKSQANELGETVTHTYDVDGNVKTTQDQMLRITTRTYDAANRPETVVPPVGNTVTYSYNLTNRTYTVTDGATQVTTHTYDLAGQLEKVELTGNKVTTYQYDSLGRKIATTTAAGTTDQAIVSYQYDLTSTDGRQETFTDQRSATTTYTYDQADRRLVTHTTDGKTTFTYDNASNVTSVHMADGKVYNFTYYDNDLLKDAEDPNNDKWSLAYLANNLIQTVQSPLSQLTTYIYDAANRLSQYIQPVVGSTLFSRDNADRIIGLQDAQGNKTTLTHWADGLLKTLTNPFNVPAGPAPAFTLPFVATTTYTYDDNGRGRTVVTPSGTTTFSYDAADRLNKLENPTGDITTYSYDSANRRVTMIDPRGVTTTFTSDYASRLKSQQSSTGSTFTYTYDAAGNVLTRADASGTTTYSYDSMNRLNGKTTPAGGLSYTFDSVGRRQTMTIQDLGPFTYTYDPASRLRTIQSPLGWVTTFNSDSVGREILRELANGVVVSQTYDTNNRLLTRRYIRGSTVQTGLQYTYNNADVRLSVTRTPGGVSTFTYDDSYQLLDEDRTETTPGWSSLTVEDWASLTVDGWARLDLDPSSYNVTSEYDASGNPTEYSTVTGEQVSADYDASDRLQTQTVTGGGTTTYTYDDAGNRVTRVTSSGTTTYTWDSEGRLTSVTPPSPGAARVFVYDADGLLAKTGTPNLSGTVAQYLWDGNVLVSEFKNSNHYWHTQRPGGFGSVISYHIFEDENPSYPQFDAVGNTIGVMDASGNLIASPVHSAFGKVIRSAGVGDGLGDPLAEWGGEQGYMYFADLDLYYVRQRWYDPSTRQWLSPDPTGVTGDDTNLYRYVRNSPVSESDPSGLAPAPEVDQRALQRMYEAQRLLSLNGDLTGGSVLFGPVPTEVTPISRIPSAPWGAPTMRAATGSPASISFDWDKQLEWEEYLAYERDIKTELARPHNRNVPYHQRDSVLPLRTAQKFRDLKIRLGMFDEPPPPLSALETWSVLTDIAGAFYGAGGRSGSFTAGGRNAPYRSMSPMAAEMPMARGAPVVDLRQGPIWSNPYSGRIVNARQLDAFESRLTSLGILFRRDVAFDDPSFLGTGSKGRAGFTPDDLFTGKPALSLPADPTVRQLVHEWIHAMDYSRNPSTYLTRPGGATSREQTVYDRMIAPGVWRQLSPAEQARIVQVIIGYGGHARGRQGYKIGKEGKE